MFKCLDSFVRPKAPCGHYQIIEKKTNKDTDTINVSFYAFLFGWIAETLRFHLTHRCALDSRNPTVSSNAPLCVGYQSNNSVHHSKDQLICG